MTKRLFIHIGTGKTGTTAVQDFCFNNNAILKNYDLKYCTTGLVENNHHLLCRNYLRKDLEAQSKITRNLSSLRNEIANSSQLNFLISSEYFPGLSDAEIQEIKDVVGFDIIPIVYLRRQDEFIESWYAQLVKAHKITYSIESLSSTLKSKGILNYKGLIDKWRKVNSNSEIIVRPFHSASLSSGSVVIDFMTTLFPDFDHPVKSKLKNKSIRPNQIVFARKVSKYCHDIHAIDFLYSPIDLLEDNSRFFLSAAERMSICNEFKLSNAEIERKYLNDEILFNYRFTDEKKLCLDIDFLEKIILLIFINHRNMISILEDSFVRILKDYVAVESDCTKARRALVLALVIRQKAPHINEMLLENLGAC